MKPTKTFDQERIHFNLGRLRKAGSVYEVVVDPDKAVAYKEGDDVAVEEVLKAEDVFFDAKKGEHASEERMEEVFGTSDPVKVAKVILDEGEVQLTAEHRNKVREDKRRRLVQLIARNACDPKTKAPHPPSRIENAMAEAKVHVDEFKKPEDQVSAVLSKLRPVIPITVEERELQVTLPAQSAAKVYGTLHAYGAVKQEKWLNDGSWQGIITLPAGMVNDFLDHVNEATHGAAQVETKQ